MKEEPDKSRAPQPEFARQWMAQKRLAAKRMAAMKLRELRSLTESDSAAIFAQLDPARPYPLRASSGLVEQQRVFRIIAERHKQIRTD